MTRSDPAEGYLTRLRAELDASGAADADDLVAEIRSLLEEAAADGGVAQALARLGEPVELARGILAERGIEPGAGISTGVWWRLGIAAPLDIAIGLAVPLAAAVPLLLLGNAGGAGLAPVALAVALGAVTLAWPFFVWRPWRAGGRLLTPGMSLTGLTVVRAPGFWRLVPYAELDAMGLAPKRRLVLSAAVTAVAAVLLASTAVWLYGLLRMLMDLTPLR